MTAFLEAHGEEKHHILIRLADETLHVTAH